MGSRGRVRWGENRPTIGVNIRGIPAREKVPARGRDHWRGVLELFAVTAPGLEALAQAELAALGIAAEPEPGGAGFEGDDTALYRANLRLRTASRVLVRMARFRARSFIELERHARRVEWRTYLGVGAPFSLRVSSRKSKLYHERAVAERFGRWIGEETGARLAGSAGGPGAADGDEEEMEAADGGQLFVVRFLRDECVVSADSSGALLHRRGYRQEVAKAPLRETLAAAAILAAGWRGGSPLLDPMCGSGTIPIEAALIARRIPPGLATAAREPRAYAFQHWPRFDRSLWDRVVAEARRELLPAAGVPIAGSDRDEGAIAAARANAGRAGVGDDIGFEVAALTAATVPAGRGLLLCNPPYGVRMGETKALRDLYAAVGKLARTELVEWEVGLLAADAGLVRQTGLEMREVLATRNGGIPVRLYVGGGRDPGEGS
ncbi:MAG TPA: hypothetical protein VMN39_04390 [Longimicrobiaceae bacterium]|nr:hypothetical protein [Longimicrobiaceae bacterium]